MIGKVVRVQKNNGKTIKFIEKPKFLMGEYIAVNWLEPEIAEEFGLKDGEIWVRKDWWEDPIRRKRLITHENVEINLRLRYGMSYEKAHKIANKFEHNVLKRLKKSK